LETEILTWKMQMSVTLLITHAFVNFLAVHDAKHLMFEVQKFEFHSVFRKKNTLCRKFQLLKASFVMFLFI